MRIAPVLIALCFLCVGVTGPVMADRREQTLLEYGSQCAREIGEIPPFDCNSGTEIPITVDGKPPRPEESPKYCDKPSLLVPEKETSEQCMPHSRILNLSRGATQISAYCRQNSPRKQPTSFFDEVVVVLHHAGNGKTCWFQSKPETKTDGIDTSRVPPPNEKTPPPGHIAAVEFWKTPAEVAAPKRNCISCHDAGPFILSPFIAQVWDKVPTDPLGKYSNIGTAFESQHVQVMSTPGNTCVGCHRIGTDQSCKFYLGFSTGTAAPGNNKVANSYPLSHWMPINNNMSHAQWDAANVKSVHALLNCCKDPKGPDCNVTPIATSDKAK
ncbi:MAG TPA: hypothetical protein VJU59_09375 [Paraburkholderia sp.]|uniref:hypothetical protein n=1 Tax=Paraburkholderia sp. TaxID=1926495 RepID=UPI002B49AAB9|nr:hypothetical protein [Paraburkholderia sp.]HKR39875.1 hypothetical protein [Paraburkholderia sp.]